LIIFFSIEQPWDGGDDPIFAQRQADIFLLMGVVEKSFDDNFKKRDKVDSLSDQEKTKSKSGKINPGGIDFDLTILNLKNNEPGLSFDAALTSFNALKGIGKNFELNGFKPVISHVAPIDNLPMFLDMNINTNYIK